MERCKTRVSKLPMMQREQQWDEVAARQTSSPHVFVCMVRARAR